MKVLDFVWNISCLICNVAHIYWMSHKYFKYDVGTNVHAFVPDYFDAPSFSICADTWRVLDWKKIMKNESLKSALMHHVDHWDKELRGKLVFATDKNVENVTLETIYKLLDNATSYEVANRKTPREIDNLVYKLLHTGVPNLFDLTMVTIVAKGVEGWVSFYNPVAGRFRSLKLLNETDYIEWPKLSCLKLTTSFYGHTKKCFLFQPRENCGRKLSYFTTRNEGSNREEGGGHFLSMTLLYDISENVNLTLGTLLFAFSRADDKYYPHSTPFLRFRPQYRHVDISLTYSEYENTFLPPPYQTNCRDFTQERFLSKDHCYETCLAKLAFNQKFLRRDEVRGLPSQLLMYRDYNVEWGRTRYVEMGIQCEEECKQRDCRILTYIPSIFEVKEQTGLMKHNHLKLHVSPTPVIRTFTIEQVTFIQFITDVTSSLGFWFGMSVIGVVDVARALVVKLVRKKRVCPTRQEREFLNLKNQMIEVKKLLRSHQEQIYDLCEIVSKNHHKEPITIES